MRTAERPEGRAAAPCGDIKHAGGAGRRVADVQHYTLLRERDAFIGCERGYAICASSARREACCALVLHG